MAQIKLNLPTCLAKNSRIGVLLAPPPSTEVPMVTRRLRLLVSSVSAGIRYIGLYKLETTDPFESSKRKYARANEHYAELHRKITEYESGNPYERVVEPDPNKPENKIHKIRLKQAPPPELSDITGDMLHNLRSALDVAAHTVAVRSGVTDPKYCAFPFAGSLAQMANSLGRSKDLPMPIQSLFVGFMPYLGGNDALWALNEMCVTDKHKMLIPVGNLAVRTGANVRGTGYFSMPDPHVWDSERNEVVLITLGPGAEYNCQFEFHMFVAVTGIRVVDGMPILKVLMEMGRSVENVITVLEFESKRLGYTKPSYRQECWP